jgi:TrmH family RNA methyltransferase
MVYISSRKNPTVLQLLKAAEKPSAEGFLVEGLHFVEDIAPQDIITAVFSEDMKDSPLLHKVEASGAEVFLASPSVMEKLSGTVCSQSAVAFVKKASFSRPSRLILLDGLQDPGNMGTVIRTAAAFGFGVVLGKGCANPFKQKVVRSSAGTVLKVYTDSVSDIVSYIEEIKEEGFTVLSSELDQTAMTPDQIPVASSMAIIIGNESKGVSPAVSAAADKKVFIPISRNSAESLNAGIAAAILMYSYRD